MDRASPTPLPTSSVYTAASPALAKQDALDAMLGGYGSVLVGYSGGVDSVYLAVRAADVLGAQQVLAVTGTSAAYPDAHRDVARGCARSFGVPHLEIATDELSDPAYIANAPDRCYHCKSELWTRLATLAREREFAVVLDGSNADDANDHRPGMRAAHELGVRSPLLVAGLSKQDIRVLSRARGLPTWDQPASPCLSSRIVYGLAVTPERLRAIETAERALRALGFRELRVRHHGDAARIEVEPAEIERALQLRVQLSDAVRAAGFQRVLLDVDGYRRGALNEAPVVPAAR